jgi:DNA end-binding protein Ku
MPRPLWTGAISFGLVSIPVRLFNAVSKKSVSFNQLDDRTMARIRYRKVSAEDGDEVPDEHIVKGYEVSKGQYVVVEPEELEPFMPVATHSIDLEEFVDLGDIDPIYFDSPYYVAPDKVTKPYALLVRAMEEAGKVAVGRFVMRNKQYVAAIRAVDGHLVLSTMVYPDEIVNPAGIDEFEGLGDVEVSAKELAMAEQLVESLAGPFEPEKFHDEYREQVLDLIGKKAAGEELIAPAPAATAPKVVDLLAALEASVQAAKESRTRHPTARKAAKGKAAPAEVEEVEEVEEAAPARSRRRKSA